MLEIALKKIIKFEFIKNSQRYIKTLWAENLKINFHQTKR
jgi:hypothetical protein